LHKHNKQNLKHAKVKTNDENQKNYKINKRGKNNRVNDITYQKFAYMLWGLQKKKTIMQISTKNGKSKHLFYIYKKNNGEKNQIKKLGKNCKQLQKKNSYKKKKKKKQRKDN